ncbi:MAG: cobaltochelatase subunit CobN, partial [Pseudomonadota bacterium]
PIIIIFYRSLLQADDMRVIDNIHQETSKRGIGCISVFVTSLKSPKASAIVTEILQDTAPAGIINITSFAIANPSGGDTIPALYHIAGCPVHQAILATRTAQQWQESPQGLHARDIAMNIALPEIDGRIITTCIAFKQSLGQSSLTETDRIGYVPHTAGIKHICALAGAWVNLQATPRKQRKLAIVLANYPNKDGRIGNGVGLDTPASLFLILQHLKKNGYNVENIDELSSGQDIITHILQGPTNASWQGREVRIALPRAQYLASFHAIPNTMQMEITAQWGAMEDDPFYMPEDEAIALGIFTLGNICIGLQPSRGYNLDPLTTYHDPDLVPPHAYLAFYFWLREEFGIQAIIQLGKHGNLEWLPGKALGLSENCHPLAILGAIPLIYPFIVNDPGEGTQAKRRNSAVVIDHMTPPLAQSGTYGALERLEVLIDEYFAASLMDPRRLRVLGEEIITLALSENLASECGIAEDQDIDQQLQNLDAYLCEIKDLQIRAGLHCFGAMRSCVDDLLFAFAKLPRTGMHQARVLEKREDTSPHQSLLRAISTDLALDFDPLTIENPQAKWQGLRPACLESGSDQRWHTHAHTLARVTALAHQIIAGKQTPIGPHTYAVMAWVRDSLTPQLHACSDAEINGLLDALDGKYVAPGPSGAPSRGRVDVLPSGRNFYSVDTRAVPTPAAWHLGWQSASRVIETYAQTHGSSPRHIGLNIWGTANMRTGGDDIAQALALIGARPRWDGAGYRVEGYEILPLDVLGRPRVDVTLRISGFFRDAFPNLITLFDRAQREIAKLDEPFSQNALAERYTRRMQELRSLQPDENLAALSAGDAIFGAMPCAYGAGLQALIDSSAWEDSAELAEAYIAWSKYAYRANADNAIVADHEFRARLQTIELVMQNQDNREHDILDSDDYYQFEGGLIAAISHISGKNPESYHNDHSNPENSKIMTLEAEIARTMRARALNP